MFEETIVSLKAQIRGDIYLDEIHKTLYATDASAYKEKPAFIVIPKDKEDVLSTINFVRKRALSIIPRTAGTSLAGQVVGRGVIVDCSKYMNRILEVNPKEKWVRVEPGVVLDELNIFLSSYNLYFGPETSTSNRCMIGGMVGNNSCGAHSLVYGSTRDHTLEVKAFLSDGSEVIFGNLTLEEYNEKLKKDSLEGKLYRHINDILSNKGNKQEIIKKFPDPKIKRRNTGYALDILLNKMPFNEDGESFNFCSLICGSEGTLAFITEIKLNLVDLPPKEKGLVVVHHSSVKEALKANILALTHRPVAVELIDKYLLDCTINSAEHSKNRFFLEGDPGALLCVEFYADTREEIERKSSDLISTFKKNGFGYSYPLLFGSDITKVWALRKAGLGLLSNIPGDAKPQPVIEDTAINPEKLPEYIDEFNLILRKYKLECVYYAHIATGELHLRPVINLKEKAGVDKFRMIAEEIAHLVKKYKGSLSGEHGDGRLRGEFVSYMVGSKNYELLRSIKHTWDPNGIFNPGKITDTPPMDKNLRFFPDQPTPMFNTMLDFEDTYGMVRMAEKCNGSADCRKSSVIGGVMCPSYQATKDESASTRARANMLRETLNSTEKLNRFDSKSLYKILDLCLSCKGCKKECPSGVDMAKLKAEFLFQYSQEHKRTLRMKLIAGFSDIQKLATRFSRIYNYTVSKNFLSKPIKHFIGFAPKSSLPKVNKMTWSKWLSSNIAELNNNVKIPKGEIVLFVDEFTNYNEAFIGITACKLLSVLGYIILFYKNSESGRAKISKGFLKEAKTIASDNVKLLCSVVTNERPLIGIEPSAILTFKDEYPDLLRGDLKNSARELKENVFTIEEFLFKQMKNGQISQSLFSTESKVIHYHGHCQQKALVGTDAAKYILGFPENYSVEEINSGCCGMAGSFGYEKEHFELANKIGELKLFPAVRDSDPDDYIVASGTSCRHHIKDNTKKVVLHPVEILWDALI